jgi:uncharacterized membrane protein YccF (DUF307 family)
LVAGRRAGLCHHRGRPWGRACFVIGKLAFFPFGKETIDRQALTLQGDIGTSPFGTLGNIIWFVFAGIWLAIAHVLSAVTLALTIIGIPFALQHLKLAAIALAPIGKTIVSREIAQAARSHNAQAQVARGRTGH